MTTTSLDMGLVERFAGQVFGYYTGGMIAYMIDIGHRTGLFEAAAQGPGASADLAERAGLHERYVREWLGSMAVSGIVSYDPATATFTLPAEHAACLTGAGSRNLAGSASWARMSEPTWARSRTASGPAAGFPTRRSAP